MQYIGLLAPLAFVYALSALSQIGVLKKEVAELRNQIARMKENEDLLKSDD